MLSFFSTLLLCLINEYVPKFLQFQSCHHSLISYRIFVNVTDLSEVRKSPANGIGYKYELKQCFLSLCVDDPCADRFRAYLKIVHTIRLLCKRIHCQGLLELPSCDDDYFYY